jgi:hypothetical protein
MPAAISSDNCGREFVAIAHQHKRRTRDRGQQRPHIGPRHDRLLLAQKGLRTGFLGHDSHAPFERLVMLAVAMDED